MFLAVIGSFGNDVATSYDGITWLLNTLPINFITTSAAWNGSLWAILEMNTSYIANATTYTFGFATPVYTGTLGISNANWYIKT
jgi:hypothetical protein